MAKYDASILTTDADSLQAARWQKFPYDYVTSACYTRDEIKAGGKAEEVVRLIPPLPHIHVFCRLWQTEKLFVTVKSRRLLLSWLCSALELWLCSFTVEAHMAVIALDQQGSEEFLGRIVWLYNHLPPKCPRPELRMWMGLNGNPKKLLFLETGSTVEALPSSPDKIRGSGLSLVRLEEVAFWVRAEESWAAILPTVQGGGRICCVSTPLAGSFFEKLVTDQLLSAVHVF